MTLDIRRMTDAPIVLIRTDPVLLGAGREAPIAQEAEVRALANCGAQPGALSEQAMPRVVGCFVRGPITFGLLRHVLAPGVAANFG